MILTDLFLSILVKRDTSPVVVSFLIHALDGGNIVIPLAPRVRQAEERLQYIQELFGLQLELFWFLYVYFSQKPFRGLFIRLLDVLSPNPEAADGCEGD